jgi:hypothetical protein
MGSLWPTQKPAAVEDWPWYRAGVLPVQAHLLGPLRMKPGLAEHQDGLSVDLHAAMRVLTSKMFACNTLQPNTSDTALEEY